MDDRASPGDGAHALEVSSLKDEIESLSRRRGSTAVSAAVITTLFVASGVLVEQTGTIWFLGALWLFFIGRLGVINRTAGNELRAKESDLAVLTSGSENPAFPNGR